MPVGELHSADQGSRAPVFVGALVVCVEYVNLMLLSYMCVYCVVVCAGQLLDHIGGNINPLRVIQKIPEGLAIDKLRWGGVRWDSGRGHPCLFAV